MVLNGQQRYFRQPIEYEVAPSRCEACGNFGHSFDACPMTKKDNLGQSTVLTRDVPYEGVQILKFNGDLGRWFDVVDEVDQELDEDGDIAHSPVVDGDDSQFADPTEAHHIVEAEKVFLLVDSKLLLSLGCLQFQLLLCQSQGLQYRVTLLMFKRIQV
ncbi:hypothetical protein NE237_008796 [Protea cynaroides]|uniref:CCHC-type domain-containing protein n=1 Tax=Protea cynaroides TaxID=273540 RepID=A0A9Q0KX66_9MAGN|nr:hypothetical protein NE237_008796 [Protea cynaroides]